MDNVKGFMTNVLKYAPTFTGPRAPELAIRDVIDVWEKASIERGDAGVMISHFGNKKWI